MTFTLFITYIIVVTLTTFAISRAFFDEPELLIKDIILHFVLLILCLIPILNAVLLLIILASEPELLFIKEESLKKVRLSIGEKFDKFLNFRIR